MEMTKAKYQFLLAVEKQANRFPKLPACPNACLLDVILMCVHWL
ncbi:hypothetical protein PMI06_003171 [Burkholderia sp. BT03]|nr:hypothetical protein PMI06_003171 [Burkholderia sp. BT03]SKC60901.1 hypothetical protein SAMN06266956_1161 [Paraburkholderia hospita]